MRCWPFTALQRGAFPVEHVAQVGEHVEDLFQVAILVTFPGSDAAENEVLANGQPRENVAALQYVAESYAGALLRAQAIDPPIPGGRSLTGRAAESA